MVDIFQTLLKSKHKWLNNKKNAIKTQTVNTKSGIFISSRIPTIEQRSDFITAGIPWDKKHTFEGKR